MFAEQELINRGGTLVSNWAIAILSNVGAKICLSPLASPNTDYCAVLFSQFVLLLGHFEQQLLFVKNNYEFIIY